MPHRTVFSLPLVDILLVITTATNASTSAAFFLLVLREGFVPPVCSDMLTTAFDVGMFMVELMIGSMRDPSLVQPGGPPQI